MPQQELDFESLNKTLDKLHRAYPSSAFAKIDEPEEKEDLTNDYFALKDLLKNLQSKE